jgi:hypothetical protein
MLLRRILVPFVLQHVEGVDEAGPGFAGFDHVVDVAALGSHVGIGQLAPVFFDQFGAAGVGVFGLGLVRGGR